MELNLFKNYKVLEQLRSTELCCSYHAQKDGKDYFLKIYHYKKDDKVTAAEHLTVQQEISKVLSKMGNISEKIYEQGVFSGVSDVIDVDLEQEYGLYQVKEWMPYDNLQKYLFKAYDRIYELLEKNQKNEAKEAYRDIQWFCWYFWGLVKMCHKDKLIHQDLKPEQIILVTTELLPTKARPVVADFDWSFFEGQMPLKTIGTPRFKSYEHVTDSIRTPASDVYTMGIISFLMLGFEQYPLYSEDECPDDGFRLCEYDDLVKRSQKKRSLETILSQQFGVSELNLEQVKKLDQLIEQCFEKNSANRPLPQVVQNALKSDLFKMDVSIEKPVHESWFQLYGVNSDNCLTVRKSDPDSWKIYRSHIKSCFKDIADRDGNLIYKYFNKDDAVPGLEFDFEETRNLWRVRIPNQANNSFNMKYQDACGKDIISKIGDSFQDVKISKLVLFSMKQNCEIESCAFEIRVKSDKLNIA